MSGRAIPIIFSAPMVRALLAGRKTQTRRLAWRSDVPAHLHERTATPGSPIGASPWQRVKPGDRLWVRESLYIWGRWRQNGVNKRGLPHWRFEEVGQRASADPPSDQIGTRGIRHIEKFWLRPSIHMPRWASRLTLEVQEVRVESLGAISRGDAMEEGCPHTNMAKGPDPRDWFRDLWGQLHGPCAWAANPQVVVLTFFVKRRNIDA